MSKSQTYRRTCPRCRTVFSAITYRGVCPNCELYSEILPDGTLLATCRIESDLDDVIHLDDPYSGPLLYVYDCLAGGGGTLIEGYRNDGYPEVDEVHRQLICEFESLRKLLEIEVPDAQYDEIDHPFSHPDWADTAYNESVSIRTIYWFDGNDREEVICNLTAEGGQIDALHNGHNPEAERRESMRTDPPEYI